MVFSTMKIAHFAGTKMPVQSSYREDQVLQDILHKKSQGMTLRAIAAQYKHITYGDIHRLLRGQFPKSPAKRKALGLPAYAPAPVCVKCGSVHTTKYCTAARKPRKPNPFKNFVILLPVD
jgi:uncharacterized protein (DUF433 family)